MTFRPVTGGREPDGRDQGVQVISRAAHVLRALAACREGMSVAAVAQDLGLPRSTTHRILRALAAEGLTRRTAEGRYALGYELESLATAARTDLRSRMPSHMLRLSSRLGETVELAVLCGTEVMLLDRNVSQRTLRATSEIGERSPAHATAAGKALLAALPDAQLADELPDPLPRFTSGTRTSRDELLTELAVVRRTAVAFDVEEHATGVCSVATVVRDQGGETAALAVVVPAARFDERDQIAAALLDERRVVQGELDDAGSPARKGMKARGPSQDDRYVVAASAR